MFHVLQRRHNYSGVNKSAGEYSSVKHLKMNAYATYDVANANWAWYREMKALLAGICPLSSIAIVKDDSLGPDEWSMTNEPYPHVKVGWRVLGRLLELPASGVEDDELKRAFMGEKSK